MTYFFHILFGQWSVCADTTNGRGYFGGPRKSGKLSKHVSLANDFSSTVSFFLTGGVRGFVTLVSRG